MMQKRTVKKNLRQKKTRLIKTMQKSTDKDGGRRALIKNDAEDRGLIQTHTGRRLDTEEV